MLRKSIAAERAEETASRAGLLRRAGVIIPTYNAGKYWKSLRCALERQGISNDQVLIVDSSSSDDTRALALAAGYRLKHIPKESFRHGATRQMAAEALPWAEALIYLTQDAIPCGDSALERLLDAFRDPSVGAAYGRQVARDEAGPIERHARLFNYPDISEVRTFASREQMGFRAAFFSNSFAAYRSSALDDVGGFPQDAIVSEEVTVAARMLIAGWKLAYQADAKAVHSHSLTIRQEFSRYFDIGVHHGREQWLLDQFGTVGGEGRTFVVSQMRYLMKTQPSLIPGALLRNLSKLCSYQLGRREEHLPSALKEAISGQPHFWMNEQFVPQTPALGGPSQSSEFHSHAGG
jgi:rhamnosyltransferase